MRNKYDLYHLIFLRKNRLNRNLNRIDLNRPTLGLTRSTVQKLVQSWQIKEQERPAIADKPARRLRKVCTVYVRVVGL